MQSCSERQREVKQSKRPATTFGVLEYCTWAVSPDVYNYYAEGGATEAYCSRAVCHSVCPLYAYLVTR